MFRLSRGQLKELALEYTLQILIPPPPPSESVVDWRDWVVRWLDVDIAMVRSFRVTTRQLLPPLIRRDESPETVSRYGRICPPGGQYSLPPLTCQFWLLEIVDDWDPPRVPPRLSSPAMPGFWLDGALEFEARYLAEVRKKPR